MDVIWYDDMLMVDDDNCIKLMVLVQMHVNNWCY